MKLNYKRTAFIGLAFLSISIFWQMYDNIIPLILKNTFGFKETLTGTIMSLDNVVALFLLPLFGTLSDKVNTRIGKRMPFILIGTGIVFVLLMLIPYADMTKNLVLFIVALFLLLLALGFYRSPAVALMPDLTPKPLRSKGNAIINLMGAIGGIIALILIPIAVPKGDNPNYYPLFISVGVVMVTCVIVLFIKIKENAIRAEVELIDSEEANAEDVDVDVDVEKVEAAKPVKLPKDVARSLAFLLVSVALWFTAYNAVTTAFSRYAQHVWKLEGGSYSYCLLVATAAAIVSYIPIGHISSRIGRKKSILIGIVLLGACFGAAGLYSVYHPSMIIFFCIIGFAWASIGVNSLPMVLEMCKVGDIGKYTGLYYTFSMSAQVITPILSGFFLEHVSYRTLFPYSTIFCVFAFLTMLMVKHGDSKPEKKASALENFDVED